MPTRRDILRAGLAASLALALPSRAFAQADPPRRPNLLFVFPDQWRRQGFGFTGEDPVLTPNLDRFAAESRVFTNAVANCPVCTPFRGMLMTGRYPHRTGLISNIEALGDDRTLPDDTLTFPDVLQDAGYAAGYVGKWHLSFGRADDVPGDAHPWRDNPRAWRHFIAPHRRHGFEFWHAYPGGNAHLSPTYWSNEGGRERLERVERWSPDHEADVAARFIRNRGGASRDPSKPWALFVAMNPPHPPYTAVPDEHLALYEDMPAKKLLTRRNVNLKSDVPEAVRARKSVAGYFAGMTGVDAAFGRILDALDESGQAEDTLVVFTSDHGDMMGSHDRIQKNVWYEESLGVPLFVRFPGRLAPGRDDLLLSAPDLMPTLLALLGVADAPADIDGRDLTRAIEGRGGRPDAQLYLSIPGDVESRGIRTMEHTLAIEWRDLETSERLFDNVSDPYQRRNLAGAEPALAAELQGRLAALLEETGDPARDWLSA